MPRGAYARKGGGAVRDAAVRRLFAAGLCDAGIAAAAGLSLEDVAKARARLGLKRRAKPHTWTAEKLAVLEAEYPRCDGSAAKAALAAKLGTTPAGVRAKAADRGLVDAAHARRAAEREAPRPVPLTLPPVPRLTADEERRQNRGRQVLAWLGGEPRSVRWLRLHGHSVDYVRQVCGECPAMLRWEELRGAVPLMKAAGEVA
jgi:hypothetical protein